MTTPSPTANLPAGRLTAKQIAIRLMTAEGPFKYFWFPSNGPELALDVLSHGSVEPG